MYEICIVSCNRSVSTAQTLINVNKQLLSNVMSHLPQKKYSVSQKKYIYYIAQLLYCCSLVFNVCLNKYFMTAPLKICICVSFFSSQMMMRETLFMGLMQGILTMSEDIRHDSAFPDDVVDVDVILDGDCGHGSRRCPKCLCHTVWARAMRLSNFLFYFYF